MTLVSPWPTVLASPLGPDRRHALVERVEPGLIGDVALGAVARNGDHRESLLFAGPISRRSGYTFRSTSRGSFSRGPGAPCSSQSGQKLVGNRGGVEPLAAAVGHGQRGLEQDQAFLGRKRSYPAPLCTLDDRRVVAFGLEAQQRELEAHPCRAGSRGRPLDCSRAWSERGRSRCGSSPAAVSLP